MRLRPQAKRRGVRGQPWCCLGLAATGRPLVLSREWERTPRMPVPRAKDPRTHQAQPKAHHLARNEGGPPVPPGRLRTTYTTPQVPSCRPREEAISLAPHEVPSSSQATRGPGAAMVLSRFGCHRSPFGSFPRVGKNSPAHQPMCKGTTRLQAQPKGPPPRAQRGRPTGAARPPADEWRNTPSRSKPPPRGGL